MNVSNPTRRSILQATAATLPWGRVQGASRLSPDRLKASIRGPILSAPTVYTENFALDHEGFRRMINLAAEAGVRVFTLTKGNNQYDNLTYEEIKALTRTMVDAVAGRGVVIAASGPWWTGQTVDYARYAESIGADAVQIMAPPDTPQTGFAKHYEAVARATKLGLVLHAQPPLSVFEQLQRIDSLVAIKEEYGIEYTTPIFQRYGNRWNVFAGGTKARLLTYQPYGMQAYYSTFATFRPDVANRFWTAVERKDLPAAREVVMKYDIPFFNRWSHPFWRATLEHFGVAKRFVRPPAVSFDDRQLAEVKTFFRELGLT